MIQAIFLTAMTVGAAVILGLLGRMMTGYHHRERAAWLASRTQHLAPEVEADRRVRTWGAMNDNNFEI